MKKYLIHLCLFTTIISCTNKDNLLKKIETTSLQIKQLYAPDSRVAIFNIQTKLNSDFLVIEGETTQPKALELLIDSLNNAKIHFETKVRILPDSAVGEKKYAVAKNSVINIRSKPKHSAELGTQGLLGMSLKVLDKKGDFYRVQTPDNYISWVDKGGIQLMNSKEFTNWKQKEKIIYTNDFGYVYQNINEQTILSDIVFGCQLILISEDNSFFKVAYPDARIGYIKKNEAKNYSTWLKNNPSDENFIETSAKNYVGIPYLWGGTSSKGMDCSGFTKMVYLKNGYIIPRDASQQIMAGKTVDENLNFQGLEKGDLMFFGKKNTETGKQKVTHVGIWLGNNRGEFIHSSGNVHLSSIDKNHPNYDEFNKNRYLGSKRYLHQKDKLIINLKELENIKP